MPTIMFDFTFAGTDTGRLSVSVENGGDLPADLVAKIDELIEICQRHVGVDPSARTG